MASRFDRANPTAIVPPAKLEVVDSPLSESLRLYTAASQTATRVLRCLPWISSPPGKRRDRRRRSRSARAYNDRLSNPLTLRSSIARLIAQDWGSWLLSRTSPLSDEGGRGLVLLVTKVRLTKLG